MFEGNERRELRISTHRECEVSSARTKQHFRNSCEIKHKYHGLVVPGYGKHTYFWRW